jgi:hypothetical protein
MQSAAASEARIFQALVDPGRRAIFESLTRGEADRAVANPNPRR